MDAVVDLINKIGNFGGIMGIGWAAWGAWDLFIGFRRDVDDKKDKGLQSILLGAVIGGVIKTLFTALANGLQSLG
ncbi:Uncharacterised protein [Streptococcus pneumoniae]|uniref:hypothetical protein n=1 Tax=Streptococcus pneumoniae TaxID=1313 RepID=UPI00061BCC89|nr:hypothetical protein [Streptococcus pneumoniae]CIV16860.1 Uncharacterised protein [Streptococcus pneumoniae]